MDWGADALRPLAGGYSGETYVAGDGPDAPVVRVYVREPDRCVVDAALLRLLRGVLPVAEVIEVRPAAGGRPGVLVLSRLPGQRLDLLLPEATAEQRVTVGRSLGRVLAVLSGIPQPRFGAFVDGRLQIAAFGEASEGLVGWVGHYCDTGRLAAWREADRKALFDLAEYADGMLAGEGRDAAEPVAAYDRVVLAHADVNPKNLLVDPDTWEVTGLVDWEFAHAGSPYSDLGNLTRFERHPDFVEAVVATLQARAPVLAEDPLLLGRCADLWALIELAGSLPSPVRVLADELLLAQARAGDVSAWPWEGLRVDPPPADRPVRAGEARGPAS